jgi:hypothetical protein
MNHIHHIIPKHMGGSNEPSNLIELTVEEHAEAHRKLWEKHGKWQDKVAWRALSGHIGKEEIIHEIHKNMNKGRVVSEATREKMAEAKRGRKISEEHKKALNEGRRKSKNSQEHLIALSKANKGKIISEQQKKLMSDNRKNHPRKTEISSMGGKMSIEKYKIDKKRQEEFSNRMKLWWKERKEKLASELRGI